MQDFFIKLIVCLVAGMGAGIGTGLSGLSAAAIVSPMLITFLGMNSYMAVGIALASDVLASAISAYTYGKNDNLDIKNGRIILVTVLLFTMVGSYVGTYIPQDTMGSFSLIMTTVLGIKFIFKPVMTTKEANADKPRWLKILQAKRFPDSETHSPWYSRVFIPQTAPSTAICAMRWTNCSSTTQPLPLNPKLR